MHTLICDVTAITLDAEDVVLHDVDILIEGKTIAAVGAGLPAPAGHAVDHVDGRECVALPAFFSAHR